jgi:hypothetical protein
VLGQPGHHGTVGVESIEDDEVDEAAELGVEPVEQAQSGGLLAVVLIGSLTLPAPQVGWTERLEVQDEFDVLSEEPGHDERVVVLGELSLGGADLSGQAVVAAPMVGGKRLPAIKRDAAASANESVAQGLVALGLPDDVVEQAAEELVLQGVKDAGGGVGAEQFVTISGSSPQ